MRLFLFLSFSFGFLFSSPLFSLPFSSLLLFFSPFSFLLSSSLPSFLLSNPSLRAWWWVHLFGFLWCGLFWGVLFWGGCGVFWSGLFWVGCGGVGGCGFCGWLKWLGRPLVVGPGEDACPVHGAGPSWRFAPRHGATACRSALGLLEGLLRFFFRNLSPPLSLSCPK